MDEPIRILHVDDDPNFVELASASLVRECERFCIDSVTGVSEGETRIERENGYDCVVSDYQMPGQNGIEFLETVRESHPDLPFILFTGKGSEEVASGAISSGVTDYLQKGGGSETFTLLSNRIQNAVSGYRTKRKLDAQERLSERIVSSSPIAIVVHDGDGDVILANERAKEILGAGAAELDADAYRSSSWRLYDESGSEVPYDSLPFSRVIEGEELLNELYTVHTDDGRVEEITVHGAPLRNEDGDVEAAIIPFRPVRE